MADANGNMESGADGSSDPNDSNNRAQENPLEEHQFTKRKRAKKSKVWIDMVEIDDGRKAQCIHCNDQFVMNATATTTTLKRHLETCKKKKLADSKQQLLNFHRVSGDNQDGSSFPALTTGKYDPATTRELISHWVLMHEHPFSIVEEEGLNLVFKSMQHKAERITRHVVKDDVMNVYEIEKKKLKNLLRDVKRISLTTDLWKSKHQSIEYMVITAHFVDANWKLQKRVLSFVEIPPPRRGIDIADTLLMCLREWEIEEKIMTISVDNASANDAAMRILPAHFKRLGTLFRDGVFFHVRCCAHILNLMVQDGLEVIKDIVEKVHASVSYINASDSRLKVFSQVAQQLHLPQRKLILDLRDPSYKHSPSDDDWEKIESICETLQAFNSCTNIISGSDYPTSNLYFGEVQYIKQVLDRQFNDYREWLTKMVKPMKEKFDKYWGECNTLMCIACILDPRCKFTMLNLYFEDIYIKEEIDQRNEDLKELLGKIHAEYATLLRPKQGNSTSVSNSCGQSQRGKNEHAGQGKGFSYYYSRLEKADVFDLERSDLHAYLEEGIYLCKDNSTSSFDILDWWKSHETKFPIL
ncbi:zinc finger BED domain-containing protein RICESLEEPER 2-like protein [Tanacetum coccineum]